MMAEKQKLLINLPKGFFVHPMLQKVFTRFAYLAEVRQTSHDTADQIREDLAWADAVVMWAWPTLDEELLKDAPNLKFAGHINDGAQGVRAKIKSGIAVSEARHGWSPAVAEMALTLMLAGLRQSSAFHIAMRDGDEGWVEDFPGDIDVRERQLTGKSVGIVGFGGIGQRLAELLAPFNNTIRIYDPFLPESVAKEKEVMPVELEDLLTQSDVVVLCAANNSGTENLMGAEQIAMLRKDAVLVNVGRASLVDTSALIKRLETGDITAMLDVFDQEPLATDDPIRKLPNAFLTPHRAGGIMESVVRILEMLADDYEAWLEDKPRQYAITENDLHKLPG